MDKNGFIAIVFVFLFVSTTCNASFVFHLRKLIASEGDNATAASQVSFFSIDEWGVWFGFSFSIDENFGL